MCGRVHSDHCCGFGWVWEGGDGETGVGWGGSGDEVEREARNEKRGVGEWVTEWQTEEDQSGREMEQESRGENWKRRVEEGN